MAQEPRINLWSIEPQLASCRAASSHLAARKPRVFLVIQGFFFLKEEYQPCEPTFMRSLFPLVFLYSQLSPYIMIFPLVTSLAISVSFLFFLTALSLLSHQAQILWLPCKQAGTGKMEYLHLVGEVGWVKWWETGRYSCLYRHHQYSQSPSLCLALQAATICH